MSYAISKDGTGIGFDKSGRGPALILVDGALCSRAFGPAPKLAPLLADRFTVYAYDRRGRGESGDAAAYTTAREIEDLAAVVDAAGGEAFILGFSSGGALALEAAAAGVPIRKLIAYEPPYVNDGTSVDGARHEDALKRLVAEGRRGDAVKYFMRDMVGAPSFVVAMMRLMPWVWRKFVAVAHTLPYDAMVMCGVRVPRDRFKSIGVPALIMSGAKSDPRLRRAARATADAVPGATLAELAGQSHAVKPRVLAPAVADYFRS